MTTTRIIFLSISGVGITIGIAWIGYILWRNQKTAALQRFILDMVSAEVNRRIVCGRDDWRDPYQVFDKVSYEDMLFSFKPFKLESWYSKEDIKMLKGES